MMALEISPHAGYIRPFDGIRGLAALSVVLAHCCGYPCGAMGPLSTHVGLGAIGVDLFFALSGFLITNILLDVRLESDRVRGLGRFYMRRSLRIFPLYFLAIVVGVAAAPHEVREALLRNIWWFVTYAVNIGKAIGITGWEPLNHFWTLAVEEQFYLMWPLLVLALPLRWIRAACLILAASSFGGRCIASLAGCNDYAVTQLTPFCLEPLAIGSYFAISDRLGQPRFALARRLFWAGLIATLAVMATSQAIQDSVSRAAHALFFGPLLLLTARDCPAWADRFLSALPLRYLGRISYGVYVWHLPVLRVIVRKTQFGSWVLQQDSVIAGLALFAVLCVAVVLVASVSWYCFERPFIRLKDRFEPPSFADSSAGMRTTAV